MTQPPSTDEGSSRLQVARRICADPTSTALLLAGPTALELWPGVRRLGEVGGRVLVEAQVAPGRQHLPATAASVTARPPRRTPTAFVTRFSWAGPGLPVTAGVLTLTYAPGGEGIPSTHAELVLDVAGLQDSRVDLAGLTAMAEGFLANLAAAAQARRRAA